MENDPLLILAQAVCANLSHFQHPLGNQDLREVAENGDGDDDERERARQRDGEREKRGRSEREKERERDSKHLCTCANYS